MCGLCNAGMTTPAAARPNGRGSGLVPGVRVSGQNITLHNWQPEQPRADRLPHHNLTAWEWQCSKMLNQAVIQGPSLFVYSDVCAKQSCVWTSSTCAVPTLAIKDRNSEVQIQSYLQNLRKSVLSEERVRSHKCEKSSCRATKTYYKSSRRCWKN